jgi:ferritin-like metal-binding protein YciE
VEHYEMAAYGSVRSYAKQLDRADIARLMQETLEEEKAADKKLTELSTKINTSAKAA